MRSLSCRVSRLLRPLLELLYGVAEPSSVCLMINSMRSCAAFLRDASCGWSEGWCQG
jgi:hypothetical protein